MLLHSVEFSRAKYGPGESTFGVGVQNYLARELQALFLAQQFALVLISVRKKLIGQNQISASLHHSQSLV